MEVNKHTTLYSIGDMVYFMNDNKVERGIVFAIQYIKTEMPFENFDRLIEEPIILQRVVRRTVDKTIQESITSSEICIYKVAIFEHDSYNVRENNPVITVNSNVLFRSKELLLASL